ncbi:hypothetical protein [Actinomadura sp. DC4]|uniref:hypothetical protein n=1 Tax=Actinomadura sp. DC4 TaxID=3055069 RepID=UPI0025B23E9D|nr:hypothetical protein [Actinomadura sp. DC4]MDN3356090.1 hypothetical protein [Actinomadura sp. DC4]
MATYTYLAADLATGNVLAELPLSGVTFSRALNDAGTISGQVRLGDRRINALDAIRATEPARTCIYVARDGVLVGDYIIWTTTYDSSTQVLQIAGADPLSYFDHRKILPTLPPLLDYQTIARQRLVFSLADQLAIARSLVTTAQAHTGGSIGVTVDASVVSTTTRDITYNGYELKSVADGLRDLAALEQGPDFYFDVTYIAGAPTRRLILGNPHLGVTDPGDNVFEYGGNLIKFTEPRDGSQMVTRMLAVGDGTDADTPIAISEDTALYSDGWRLLEDNTSYSGTITPADLQGHANADRMARSSPIVLPALTVTGDGPPAVGEYLPGDAIRRVIPRNADPYFPAGSDRTLRLISFEVHPPSGNALETVDLVVSSVLEAA